MVETVGNAARQLGLPNEVMGNFLRLVESVEEAVHEKTLSLKATAPHVNQAELLESLIDEYSHKL